LSLTKNKMPLKTQRSLRTSSSSERAKVGLVGFGRVARVHVDAYRECDEIVLVSVAENDSAKLDQARRELGIPVYSSSAEMLQSEVLDIVCVLTPPASHEELVCEAAGAGVHVLCEKPMSLTVQACERMIEACRSRNVRLCYGASYRYLPALTTARQMILGGEIGEVLVLREYMVGGTTRAKRSTLDFQHYPKGGPGGSGMGLCDHGIHLIDIFPWLMDSAVTAVSGRGNVSGEPQRAEYASLEYANGAIGQLLYEDGTFTTTLPTEGAFAWGGSWNGSSGLNAGGGGWNPDPGCIHVHGTMGSLRIYHYANLLFHRSESGVRQIQIPDRPVPHNFTMQLEAFIEAIRSGAATPVPGEVGLEAVRTLLGIYDSRVLRFSARPT
jgi:UDP-N-acetyl-2-amino-2-deoxyglucuronate dehydrogenase